jgi:hypothetical protein
MMLVSKATTNNTVISERTESLVQVLVPRVFSSADAPDEKRIILKALQKTMSARELVLHRTVITVSTNIPDTEENIGMS